MYMCVRHSAFSMGVYIWSLFLCVLNFFSLPLVPICPPPCPRYPALLHITPRLEPEILLRAKQDFMKIDSAADLE